MKEKIIVRWTHLYIPTYGDTIKDVVVSKYDKEEFELYLKTAEKARKNCGYYTYHTTDRDLYIFTNKNEHFIDKELYMIEKVTKD